MADDLLSKYFAQRPANPETRPVDRLMRIINKIDGGGGGGEEPTKKKFTTPDHIHPKPGGGQPTINTPKPRPAKRRYPTPSM